MNDEHDEAVEREEKHPSEHEEEEEETQEEQEEKEGGGQERGKGKAHAHKHDSKRELLFDAVRALVRVLIGVVREGLAHTVGSRARGVRPFQLDPCVSVMGTELLQELVGQLANQVSWLLACFVGLLLLFSSLPFFSFPFSSPMLYSFHVHLFVVTRHLPPFALSLVCLHPSTFPFSHHPPFFLCPTIVI